MELRHVSHTQQGHGADSTHSGRRPQGHIKVIDIMESYNITETASPLKDLFHGITGELEYASILQARSAAK